MARVNANSTVYYGPDNDIYASVGSVYINDSVQIHGKENGWLYVEYPTASKTKRGYIPASIVENSEEVLSNAEDRLYTGYLDVATQSTTIFTGPGESYAQAGSVSINESVTVFNEVIGDFTYVEYSAPTSTKRGYIKTNLLEGRKVGVLGKVIADEAATYSGPDSAYYRCGSVFNTEYVIILNRDIVKSYDNYWYYIEYNTSGGRKRGYVLQSAIEHKSILDNIYVLNIGYKLAKAVSPLNVYYGPGTGYAVIGSIGASERVSVLTGRLVESEYSYIEYNTRTKTKRGYVATSTLTDTVVQIPEPPSNSVVATQIYGYSGNNRPLHCYKIGSGSNVLAAVFAMHGYEDAWAADGEELCKIANGLITEIANDKISGNLDNWTVYIIPCANPDGLLDGWTNNGPGRTARYSKVDLNRCFPVNFEQIFAPRNYTGSTSLGAPEAVALRDVLQSWIPSSGFMVLLDVHGWLNQTIGSSLVGKYYCEQFTLTNSSVDNAKGYLTRWGQSRGMYASLIELPYPASSDDIISRDFAGKFVTATRNLLCSILPEVGIPVTGININKNSADLQTNSNVQLAATIYPTTATNKKVIWSSSDTAIATVDHNGLVTSLNSSGSAVITAASEDGGYTATCTIAVSSTPIALTNISVQPTSITFTNLGSKQLTITYTPANASNKEVTWTSSNTEVATVSNEGLVTVGNANGTATITATSADSGHTATTIVTVNCSSIQNQIKIMTDEILARAAAVTDFEWTPIENVYKWNSTAQFIKGTMYTGLPYTLDGQYTVTGFQSLYNQRTNSGQCYLHSIDKYFNGLGQRKGPSIGSCCASLVSEAWGLTYSEGSKPLFSSVSVMINHDKVDVVTNDVNFNSNLLKAGDALAVKGHTLLIGNRNIDGTFKIFEETPTIAVKYDATINKVIGTEGDTKDKACFKVYNITKKTSKEYNVVVRLKILNELYHSI